MRESGMEALTANSLTPYPPRLRIFLAPATRFPGTPPLNQLCFFNTSHRLFFPATPHDCPALFRPGAMRAFYFNCDAFVSLGINKSVVLYSFGFGECTGQERRRSPFHATFLAQAVSPHFHLASSLFPLQPPSCQPLSPRGFVSLFTPIPLSPQSSHAPILFLSISPIHMPSNATPEALFPSTRTSAMVAHAISSS